MLWVGFRVYLGFKVYKVDMSLWVQNFVLWVGFRVYLGFKVEFKTV